MLRAARWLAAGEDYAMVSQMALLRTGNRWERPEPGKHLAQFDADQLLAYKCPGGFAIRFQTPSIGQVRLMRLTVAAAIITDRMIGY